VLREFDLDAMPLVGVAKGPARKPGQETLVLSNAQRRVRLPANSDALRLIQQIRDEAHRFAIQGHRRRRARNRSTSVLERIAGIGPRRRRDLLRHFGGLPGVSRAGVDELAKVRGINKNLARKIYSALHGP
jgi:excinuclease ABC subunit C